jgi:hypothetical protein
LSLSVAGEHRAQRLTRWHTDEQGRRAMAEADVAERELTDYDAVPGI